MSAVREVKQLVERLLQLTDGGLVVREGDGEDPAPGDQTVRTLQAKVDDLNQQMRKLELRQVVMRWYHVSGGCFTHGCCTFGCKPFRAALAKQLRSPTGIEPSLVQKKNQSGQLQWAVESLLR
ncbi:hypothetical protein FOA52_009021 [Chlamydomonas sp. UWO 241]|nr:hypothetical protein FOA52_009021 [Chlamydomonas sp. UWO 241]